MAAPLRAAPERWNHGAAEHVEKSGHSRVADGVHKLYLAGKISAADVSATEQWYRDYTLGVMGVFDAEPGAGSGGGDAHTAGFARAKAANDFRQASFAVGATGANILRWFVADGWTFEAVGLRLALDRKSAVGAVVATIRRLTEHCAASQPVGGRTIKIRNADFSA